MTFRDPRITNPREGRRGETLLLEVINRETVQLNPVRRSVIIHHVEVEVPPTPFLVAHGLASRPGEVRSPRQILELIDPTLTRGIDLHANISTLRERIRTILPRHRDQPEIIQAVHEKGYRWVDPLPRPFHGMLVETSPQPEQARLGVEGLSMREEQIILYKRRGMLDMHVARDLRIPVNQVDKVCIKARFLGIPVTPEEVEKARQRAEAEKPKLDEFLAREFGVTVERVREVQEKARALGLPTTLGGSHATDQDAAPQSPARR